VITSDSPDRPYSTRLRTAIALTGSGTAGAYHAGVLRALHEAGVRVDVVAGRGIGAAGAMFAAVDGGPRLWDEDGIWKSPSTAHAYGWRRPLRIAGIAVLAAAAFLCVPLVPVALGVIAGVVGILLTMAGLKDASAALTSAFARWLDWLFSPDVLPTVVPRLVFVCVLVAVATLAAGVALEYLRQPARRRVRRGAAGWFVGAPLAADLLLDRCAADLWNLIRGAAPIAAPARRDLGRKYVELLAENLGQPGFRELLVAVHDLDARRDFIFALLAEAHRARFFARPAGDGGRHAEAFDLAAVGRDHAFDALAASLRVPLATEPHLVTLAAEGPWRGETHRLCDRPGAIVRLLEEVLAAGAEQIVIVSAAPPPGRPHELNSGRGDLRGRTGETLAAHETAVLRDVAAQFEGRVAGLYLIRPAHNPLGPLDFAGVYDERSDRHHTLGELVDRGYEDAYRQFIEPVVAASGDRIQVQS
jgi:hypothetical protein